MTTGGGVREEKVGEEQKEPVEQLEADFTPEAELVSEEDPVPDLEELKLPDLLSDLVVLDTRRHQITSIDRRVVAFKAMTQGGQKWFVFDGLWDLEVDPDHEWFTELDARYAALLAARHNQQMHAQNGNMSGFRRGAHPAAARSCRVLPLLLAALLVAATLPAVHALLLLFQTHEVRYEHREGLTTISIVQVQNPENMYSQQIAAIINSSQQLRDLLTKQTLPSAHDLQQSAAELLNSATWTVLESAAAATTYLQLHREQLITHATNFTANLTAALIPYLQALKHGGTYVEEMTGDIILMMRNLETMRDLLHNSSIGSSNKTQEPVMDNGSDASREPAIERIRRGLAEYAERQIWPRLSLNHSKMWSPLRQNVKNLQTHQSERTDLVPEIPMPIRSWRLTTSQCPNTSTGGVYQRDRCVSSY